MKKLVLALLAAVLLLPLSTLPAEADGPTSDGQLTVTTHDLALWSGYCGNSGYSIDTSFPGAASWTVDVTVYDPHGAVQDGDTFSDPTTLKSGSTYLCQDYDLMGTYRVVAEYTTYDADDNQIGSGSTTGTFVLSTRQKYSSVLRVARTPLGRHLWKISGSLTRNGRWWSGHYVSVQVYVAHSWHTLRTTTTNSVGHLYFYARPTSSRYNRYYFRLHSTGGTYVRDANSVSFHLPKR